MFDVGWPEILVIAIVLIVVVGPKDLPQMLRAFGRTTKKLRAMASEFRGQFDEVLREAELDGVKKTLEEARSLNPMREIKDAVNPLKSTGEKIRSDLESAVKPASGSTAAGSAPAPKVEVPAPAMKLADGPPPVPVTEEKTATAAKDAKSGANAAGGKGESPSFTRSDRSTAKMAGKAAPKPAAGTEAKTAETASAGARPAAAKPAKKTTSKAARTGKDKA